MSKPVVAVTMGDPSGIGPEVVVKAARDAAVRRACRVVIVGDAALLQHAHAPRWPNRESGSAAPTDAPVLVESVTRLKPAASPARPFHPERRRSILPLHPPGGGAHRRRRRRRHGHGAHQQEGAERRRPRLARAHRAVGRPHPHAGSSDDAVRVASQGGSGHGASAADGSGRGVDPQADPHHHRADPSVAAGVVRPGGAAVGGGRAEPPRR